MKLWLTRQFDGSFMLTLLRPTVVRVRGTSHEDAYIAPGEPIGVRHLCREGVEQLFGPEAAGIALAESVRVDLSATLIE